MMGLTIAGLDEVGRGPIAVPVVAEIARQGGEECLITHDCTQHVHDQTALVIDESSPHKCRVIQ